MPEESYSFATARTRLEEIVAQVRKKDTSLEKSLDLLEEGVRLANQCTELIDHADWEAAGSAETDGVEGGRGEPQPLSGDDGAATFTAQGLEVGDDADADSRETRDAAQPTADAHTD